MRVFFFVMFGAFMTDEDYARALNAGFICSGSRGGQVCYNAPNEGYDLCEECYRRIFNPHAQTCSACGKSMIMGQNCSDPMCITMYHVREGATYEEMTAFDEADRAKRTLDDYESTNKKEIYDVSEHKAEDEAASCVICIEDIKVGERIVRLPCDGKHPFHEECILSSFKATGIRCPTCMTDLKNNHKRVKA